jgi:hypothetical protein
MKAVGTVQKVHLKMKKNRIQVLYSARRSSVLQQYSTARKKYSSYSRIVHKNSNIVQQSTAPGGRSFRTGVKKYITLGREQEQRKVSPVRDDE